MLNIVVVELVEREVVYPVSIMILLIISLVILIFSKWLSPNFFNGIYKLFFSIPRDRVEAFRDGTLKSNVRLLLMANTFIGLVTSTELFRYSIDLDISYLFVAPLIYIVWNFFSLNLTKIFTGEYHLLTGQNTIIESVYQSLGVILVPINLAWYLNPQFEEIFVKGLVLIFVLFFFYRITKSFLLGISKQISWYYLILYLCTLEIWPLVLVYTQI